MGFYDRPKQKSVPIEHDFEQMLISAERYALGRMTYTVGDTVNYILSIVKDISGWCIYVMLDDLKSAYATAERTGDYRMVFGMDCDKVYWDKLYEALQKEWECRQEHN